MALSKYILCAILLSGCSGIPYAEVGLGYQIDNNSDWWVRQERGYVGRNPWIHAELGLEFKHKISCGYHHQSKLIDGGPFNHNPEIYIDDIRCTKRWGGK